MRQRRVIVFDDGAKVPLRESMPTGSKHRNVRQPNGPVCGEWYDQARPDGSLLRNVRCMEPLQPICANRSCPGAVIPRLLLRAERSGGSQRFDGRARSAVAIRQAFRDAEQAARTGTRIFEALKRLREAVCGGEQSEDRPRRPRPNERSIAVARVGRPERRPHVGEAAGGSGATTDHRVRRAA